MATSRRQDDWLDRHHARHPTDQDDKHAWTRGHRSGLVSVSSVAVVLALLLAGLIIVTKVAT
jgi:hypothetical protein